MTYTTVQIRNRVAEDLGIKGQDTELSDEQAAKLEERINTITAHYREQGLFWWADNAVPDVAVDGVVLVMCAFCCASVRKAGQGHEAKLAPGLTLIAAVKPSAKIETLRTTYY